MQKTPELELMWREYKQTGAVELRNRLIEAYLPVVDYLAERIWERLPLCVELDDVRSAGVFGLLNAVEGFDLSRNIKFETYCSLRIRGAILDELRGRDWVPRLVRSRTQKFAAAVRSLQSDLGRPPTQDEVMEQLNLEADEYEKLQRELTRLNVYSLSEAHDSTHSDESRRSFGQLMRLFDTRTLDPATRCQNLDSIRVVLARLPRQERQVIELCYLEGLSQQEVAHYLHLTVSRICQVHTQAMQLLEEEFAGVAP